MIDNENWLDSLDNTQPKLIKPEPTIEAVTVMPSHNELQEMMRGDKYYTDRTAFSNSMFARLEKDEVEFHNWYTGNAKDPINNVFANGQFLHTYMAKMIDPTYEDECRFLILPKLDMRTKAGKEKYVELTSGVNLEEVYTVDEYSALQIKRLCDNFLRSEYFQRIMAMADSTAVEKAYMRQKNGLTLKGKLDFEANFADERLILDWKTSANYADFAKKAYAYGYNRQGACYDYIAESDRFAFVVFDTVTFQRWKVVEIDKSGAFYGSGMKKLNASIEMAKNYLQYGLDYAGFSFETI